MQLQAKAEASAHSVLGPADTCNLPVAAVGEERGQAGGCKAPGTSKDGNGALRDGGDEYANVEV